MIKIHQIAIAWTTLAVVASSAHAQQQPLPLRPLGPRLAIAKDTFKTIIAVRQLGDGRVLVSDFGAHRLLLYDAMLRNPRVIMDSGGVAARLFGRGPGLLIAYAGDSTLFVDGGSQSLLLIDPQGAIARVIAIPRTLNILYLSSTGAAALDAQQRLVYRLSGTSKPVPTDSDGARTLTSLLDSQALVRADLTTRTIDTAGWVHVTAPPASTMILGPNGRPVSGMFVTNPLPASGDDWVVLSEGSIGFVRGRDYHLDWLGTDGSRSSAPAVPHLWTRVDDAEKTRLSDSLKAVYEAHPVVVTIDANAKPPKTVSAVQQVVPITQMADYHPAFRVSGSRADADGHVWIQTLPAPTEGGTAYDVVDGRGALVDRVQLPPSLSLLGFGPGVVYMTSREGNGIVLVKARIHQ